MLGKFAIPILLIIILGHVFILTKLIYFPYPELFVYPYLTNHGLKPYSQILDQHFPGLMFLPVNLDNLGMNNEVIARYWSMGIIILVHLLLFFIAASILKSRKKALLVNVLYLIWQPFFEGWVLWIDSFLPLLLLPAFYFHLRKKYFLTGIFLGLGIVFKQTLIPLGGLVLVWMIWEVRDIRMVLRYITGLVLPVGLMLLYLFSIGVLADFWYWTVVFNLTVFAKYGTTAPTTFGLIARPLLVYSGGLLLFFLKDRKMAIVLLLFLLGSMAGIFDRADFVHFQPSLPFVLLASTLGIYQLFNQKLLKILLLTYSLIAVWWLGIFYKGHISNQVLFFDPQTKLLASKIHSYADYGQTIFIFGASPGLYQMTKTRPAGNIFVFQFPWFFKVAEGRILNGIKQDKPNIIVSDRTVKIEDQPITEFGKEIDQYINENYQLIDQVGTTQIMRRKVP